MTNDQNPAPQSKMVEPGQGTLSVPAPSGRGVEPWQPPQACDGKEQVAFEEWAISHRYDMHEHPLHYIFMDPKTNAARMGWNAALKYVRDQFSLATPTKPNEDRMREPCRDELMELLAHFDRLGIKNKAAYERALRDFRAALANISEAP